MHFNRQQYIHEMMSMVDVAIERMKSERPDFEIYTASIWTDPNAAASSISFDSKTNSDLQAQKSNEWSKKYYDKYMAAGDFEQAKRFAPKEERNTNPVGFQLRDFSEINNSTIEMNWEENSEGACWEDLDPCLKEIGSYAFNKIIQLNVHDQFELSVNGSEDWYQVIWNKNNKLRPTTVAVAQLTEE